MLTIKSYCWICGLTVWSANTGICYWCQSMMSTLPTVCHRCGLPANQRYPDCGRCLVEPPAWHHLIAVSDYQPPFKQLIWRLKFKGHVMLARMLSRQILMRFLFAYREHQLPKPNLIVSIPLHRYRLWRRGFNQADLLARPLAHWLQCRYVANTVQRVIATANQHQLSLTARKLNLAQAFSLKNSVEDLTIAIVDDVVTSGARSVQLWCLCRTL
jgi:ComF family protein